MNPKQSDSQLPPRPPYRNRAGEELDPNSHEIPTLREMFGPFPGFEDQLLGNTASAPSSSRAPQAGSSASHTGHESNLPAPQAGLAASYTGQGSNLPARVRLTKPALPTRESERPLYRRDLKAYYDSEFTELLHHKHEMMTRYIDGESDTSTAEHFGIDIKAIQHAFLKLGETHPEAKTDREETVRIRNT